MKLRKLWESSDEIEKYYIKVKNSILAFVVGDALGVPYEFSTRQEMDALNYDMHAKSSVSLMREGGTHGQPIGTWSDDTSMMLCTMQSIVDCQAVNPEHIAKLFVKWKYENLWNAKELFDIGITTSDAIDRLHQGCSHLESGINNERMNGNGALMRMLPLAFIDNLSKEVISEIAQITHGHEISTNCCLEYIKKVKTYINSHAEIIRDLERDRNKVLSDGYVVNTLNAVKHVLHFSQLDPFTKDPIKVVLDNAVLLGGDTDTIAALCGGLIGCLHEFSDNIGPSSADYLSQIVRIDEIIELVDKYIEVLKKINTRKIFN